MESSDVRYSALNEKSSVEDLKWSQTTDHPLNNLRQQQLSETSKMSAFNEIEQAINPTRSFAEQNKINTNNSALLDHQNPTLVNNNCIENPQDILTSPSVEYFNSRTKKSQLIRLLLLIIMSLVLVNFVFSIIFIRNFFTSKQASHDLVKYSNLSTHCLSDKCIVVTGRIHKSLNKAVDPCDNFYEYACGGWLQQTLIPSGFPRWGTLISITYKNQLIIRKQLEAENTPNLTESERKAKRFFKSCMDPTGRIEKLGSKPLMDILDIFIKKNENAELVIKKSFSEILFYIQNKFGLNAFFDLEVLDDDKNSTFNNIEITQGTLGLEKSFYLNKTEKNINTVEVYKRTMVSVFGLLFGEVKNVTDLVEDMVELESKMAQIMYDSDKISDVEKVYQRVSLNKLTTKYASFINWVDFINQIFRTFGSREVLNENDVVVVIGLDYFTQLTRIIDDYRKVPEKEHTLKMFTIFYLIRFSLPLLSSEYRNQFSDLNMAMTGSQQAERWQICVDQTDNIFGLGYAVARLFIRNSPNDVKKAAEELITSIKRSFVKNFVNIPWMNKNTRVLAEEKVKSVGDLIGYPEFIENDKLLDNLYKEIVIKEDDYFANEINLIHYALKKEILMYRTPVNRGEWEMTPSAVNAYYSPTRNQIVFPNGILQEPFFHPEYPMYLNYGSMGSVMGHELAHGFDNSGREYDKNGMLNQWWDLKTINDFDEASDCMVNQYSAFSSYGESLNGKMTLGENIADNGGLRAAYNAYEEWLRRNGEEKPLATINLNTRQLFFVSFAQTWCTKNNKDSAHFTMSIDQHSPPEFRVIGTLSNSDEFAKAFQCPAGSKMNPVKKCKLW